MQLTKKPMNCSMETAMATTTFTKGGVSSNDKIADSNTMEY